MRTKTIRSEIQQLIRQVPFRPFILTMESGESVPIEHPENIAFDPDSNGTEGSIDFHVVSGRIRLISTFEAVSSISLLDTGRAR